jgi:hypothetical protein
VTASWSPRIFLATTMGITGLFLQEYVNRYLLVTGARNQEPGTRNQEEPRWALPGSTAPRPRRHLVCACASPCRPYLVDSYTDMPTSHAARSLHWYQPTVGASHSWCGGSFWSSPPPQPPQTLQTLQTSVFLRSAGETHGNNLVSRVLQTSQTYPPLPKAGGDPPPRRGGLPR